VNPAAGLPPLNVLGLMSGTSLDGIDALVVRLEERDGTLAWEILDRESRDYPADVRSRLQATLKPETSDVLTITQLHTEVGASYAGLCAVLAGRTAVDLVALSGQTVYHVPRIEPARGWHTKATLQLGEAALTLERLGVPVISDFRQSDLAAGGEGAPLVSFGDLKLYGRAGVNRAVHNLGGISNLTFLPADLDPAGVIAFDTGPANCLLDEAAAKFLGLPCDQDGATAARGTVSSELLERLLAHPYLQLAPPKTTGREVFTLDALLQEQDAQELAGKLDAPDLLATLTAYTAETVARAYAALPVTADEILVAGGGSLNPTLMSMLRQRIPIPLRTFAEAGFEARDREALAFAVMAYYGFFGHANTLPHATGAAHAVVAGKLLRPPGKRGAAD
jgi:anhydro-N-acetylmuramic acid kinase